MQESLPRELRLVSSNVVSLQDRRRSEKEARSDRYGRRVKLFRMSLPSWSRDYEHSAIVNQLLSLTPHFSRTELAAALYVAHNQGRGISRAEIARGIGCSRSWISRVVRSLGEAGVLVQVDDGIRINPQAEVWQIGTTKRR